MGTVAELLGVEGNLVEVVDVGANPVDGDPPYLPLMVEGLCRVTGFEPQPAALEQLLQRKGTLERYLPYAVGDGGSHTLRVCAGSGMTSLFEPDPAALALFPFLAPFAEVRERLAVATRRLDEIEEIERLDYLKIDIQGGELAVFESGRAKLAQAVVVQTEVSFLTLYQDQPAFGDVDRELRAQGFVPHCFAAVKRWPIAPCVVNDNPRWAVNQLLEADVVYVRDITRPEGLDDQQLKRIVLVAHHCYRSYDLAMRCVEILESRGALPAGTRRRYLDLVGQPNLSLWEDHPGLPGR